MAHGGMAASEDGEARGLLRLARDLLDGLGEPRLDPFLADWPDDGRAVRDVTPDATLPVLRWLGEVTALAGGPRAALSRSLAVVPAGLAWRQTYAAGDVGAAFLERYGWTELAGLRGPIPSARLACGFLLLGPDTLYPPHRHAAEEVYLPLGGTASWWTGRDGWTTRPPGEPIHHPSWLPHATRTGAEPLLALYLWRGGDLAQRSELVAVTDPSPRGA